MVQYKPSQSLGERLRQDAEDCISCKLCMRGCPMLEDFGDDPKDIYQTIEQKGSYPHMLPFSCLLCGYCEKVCPKGISCKDAFYQMRLEIIEQEGKVPDYTNAKGGLFHQKVMLNHTLMKPAVQRGKSIFFPGCGLQFDDNALVMDVFRFMKKHMDVGISNACCAKPTAMLGLKEEADSHVAYLEKEWKEQGVTQIIAGCQNCFLTLHRDLKEIPVVSVYEILAEIGVPEAAKNRYAGRTMVIHDPCPTRNQPEIHDAVRSLSKELGINVEELAFSREKTLCCGKGGMTPHTAPETSIKHVNRRRNEFTHDCLTYCRECTNALASPEQKTFHMLDLLFSKEPMVEQKPFASPIAGYARRIFSKGLMK